MIAVAMTVYDGLLSMIFQPIIGVIFSSIASFFLLLLGLPIRLNRTVNRVWKRYWWIALVLAGIGIVLMACSWLACFRKKVFVAEGQEFESFHPALSIGGWLVMLFAVLHFFPPFLTSGDEKLPEGHQP
jgi:fatty acid desaturase